MITIEKNDSVVAVSLGSIPAGGLFLYQEMLFLKVSSRGAPKFGQEFGNHPIKAVKLVDGEAFNFEDSKNVFPCVGKLKYEVRA